MYERTGREKFNMNLINEVRKHEILYNNAHHDFRNKELKEDTWNAIGRVLCFKGQQCRERWKDLRKQYAKVYLKMTTPGAIRNSYWRYTDAMSFLKPYEAQKAIALDPVGGGSISKCDMYCRACLCKFIDDTGKRSKSYNIFEIIDLADMLTQCSNSPVVQWDEYPQAVCEKCYKKVVYFSQFQQMCRTSLEKFNSILHDPKQVTIDLNEALDDSLNCSIEDTNLNSLLEDVKGPETPPPTVQKLKEIKQPNEMGNKTPPSEYDIDVDDIIMEEIIQVEIERNTECDSTKSDEIVVVDDMPPIQEEEILEDGSDEVVSGEIKTDEDELDYAEYVDDEDDGEDEYIVDELSDEEEEALISDKDLAWNVKTSVRKRRGFLKCEICPKKFLVQHRLEAHQRRHQGLSGYPCPYGKCERAFNRPDELRAHLNDHKGFSNAFKCNIDNCRKVYSCHSSLKHHKRRDHNVVDDIEGKKKTQIRQNYICETCGQILCSHTALQRHRLIHVDKSQWPYVCDEKGCTRRFRISTQLRIHKNRHAGIKNYVCPHCGVRKTTSTELKIHINYHTFERKYPCRNCAKVFKSAGVLSKHVRQVHEMTESFECRFCDRKCNTAQNLKHHEMIHTGERPYACQECGKAFATPMGRSSHMQMHATGEKQHACPECGKRFKWLANLTSHKKLHVEGAIPYTCEECGQGFRWPGAYYGHKKKHMLEKMRNVPGDGENIELAVAAAGLAYEVVYENAQVQEIGDDNSHENIDGKALAEEERIFACTNIVNSNDI